MAQKEFVPLEKLVEQALPNPSKLQLQATKRHEEAVENWQRFGKTGAVPGLTGVEVLNREDDHPWKLENDAHNSARNALLAALQYYHSHGKVQDAYAELREFARQHWHSAIHTNWATEVRQALRIMRATVPAGFKEALQVEADEEARNRRKLLDEGEEARRQVRMRAQQGMLLRIKRRHEDSGPN